METNTLILIIASIAGVVVVAISMIFGMGKVMGTLERLFTMAQSNPLITSNLDKQFNRLDPSTQRNLQTLVNVLDPFVQFTNSDLDDRMIIWLKTITDGKENG